MFAISIGHGPSAFLATALGGKEFLYRGYKMAAFPDSVDKMTPKARGDRNQVDGLVA